MGYKEIKCTNVKLFHLEDEPEVIYVISLRLDQYMVVHDDAYEFNTGKVELLNSEDIENIYGITLE
jgi:hypothetical protein